MSSTTVRISSSLHETLRQLAEETGTTMNAVLESALNEYQKRLFWSHAAAEFRALQNDPRAWDAEQRERAAWDATLADGLED